MNYRRIAVIVAFLSICIVIAHGQYQRMDCCDGNLSNFINIDSLSGVVSFIINETSSLHKMDSIVNVENILKVIKANKKSREIMMRKVYVILNRAQASLRGNKAMIHIPKSITSRFSHCSSNIDYFVHRFKFLAFKNRSVRLKESDRVLNIDDGIQKWLFELKTLFMGRTELGSVTVQPLLLQVIDKFSKTHGCSAEHKSFLDTLWRDMILCQCKGFLLWAHALQFRAERIGFVAKSYKTTICNEIKTITNETCDLVIDNSVNLQCTDGFYSSRSAEFNVQCNPNYYLSSKPKKRSISCTEKKPKCLPCNCNARGSTQSECDDETGKCLCDKNHYFGHKCQDRHCHWTSWSTWGSCSKTCGYGITTRVRAHAIDQAGNGKQCGDENKKSKTCIQNCCDQEFHCQQSKACISEKDKCNAVKDCVYGEDETNCDKCISDQTKFDLIGNHVYYLDRQNVACSNATTALQSFVIRNNGDKSKIKYEFACCQMKRDVCNKVYIKTTAVNHPSTYFTDLSKLPIQCKYNGMLQRFRLIRPSKTTMHYHVTCCETKAKFRKIVRCYDDKTPVQNAKGKWISEMGGTKVQCKREYYLNSLRFVFDSVKKKWNYAFRCCSVIY